MADVKSNFSDKVNYKNVFAYLFDIWEECAEDMKNHIPTTALCGVCEHVALMLNRITDECVNLNTDGSITLGENEEFIVLRTGEIMENLWKNDKHEYRRWN